MTSLLDSSGFAPWLLRSRIAPPRQRRQLIMRPRVERYLDRATPGQVVLVCAPPGFGKSAALAQWSSTVLGRGDRVAWLSVDAADEPSTLLHYLAFALHASGLAQARAPHTGAAPTLALQSLLAAIERSGSSWLVVLDDVERSSAAVMREVIEPLCRFMPENSILAVASREAGMLDTSSLSDRGLLITVGTDALRFDRDEVQQLWGMSATRAQVRTVEQRSGGWPALLQVMLEQGATSYFDRSATPAGTATAAAAFFESRLLARLEDPIRSALLRLSMLVAFPLAIARELLAASTSECEALLARLSTLGVLARSETPTGTEYCIYPVVRDYLALCFSSQDPQSVAALHRLAAKAYLRHGDIVAATRHAAMVADDTFLADIVESVDPLLLGLREGFPRLRQIVRLVPEAVALARPRIGYACVTTSIKAGRLKEAHSLFQKVEEQLLVNGERHCTPVVQFERAVALSLLAVYKGTPISEREIQAFDTFISTTPSLAPIVRSVIETLRSFVWQQNSRFEEARAAARLSVQHVQVESPYAAYFNYCDLGMFAGIQGHIREAFEQFDAGDRACAAIVRTDERLSSIRDAFRLELEHEVGSATAEPLARLKNVCIRLPSLEGWPDVYSAAFRTYSEQLFLSDDLSGALAILEVGLDYLYEQEIVGAPVVLRAQRAMLLALSGRSTEGRAEFERTALRGMPAHQLLGRPWRESEALVEAEAAIALASGEKSRWLTAAIRFAEKHGNLRSEIRFRTWAGCFGARGGRLARASHNEERLAQLLSEATLTRTATLSLAAGFDRGAGRPAPRPGLNVVSMPVRSPYYLTPREFDVITCLGRGLSDKAIAKELGITAHGVRYHLKRIYAKLHVNDRLEASRKAGKLGLM